MPRQVLRERVGVLLARVQDIRQRGHGRTLEIWAARRPARGELPVFVTAILIGHKIGHDAIEAYRRDGYRCRRVATFHPRSVN